MDNNLIHRCVKVGNLRKYGYESFKEWLEKDDNLYCGRFGRIFIKNKESGEMEIFHYKSSKFCNPYKVSKKDYTLEESLEKYKKYILEKFNKNDFEELLKYDELGCFCNEDCGCHVKVLIEILKEL